jgi:hypothetical protein
MSVADKMLKEIVTLAKELAVQEHENKQELSEQGLVHGVELQRETADLQQQLDAALASLTRERLGAEARGHELERLRRFVGGVEGALGAFQSISPDTCCDQIARCLSELEDSPAPVAEPAPCPECERWQRETERLNTEFVASTAEVIELHGHLVKLREFVAKARETISRRMNYCDVEFLLSALAELDAGTAEHTPVAETLDGEGGQ